MAFQNIGAKLSFGQHVQEFKCKKKQSFEELQSVVINKGRRTYYGKDGQFGHMGKKRNYISNEFGILKKLKVINKL